MKKHDHNLFQIGEVTKIMGITRKTLLVFEEMGLLVPAVKDEESGYRYYSADNMTQIRSIRSLMTYVQEHHIEVTSPFHSIYLEGPPNRGEHTEDYITQVAVPVK